MNITTFTTAKARKNFSEIINRATYGKERIILSRHGKALLALVPLDDLRLIELAEELKDIEDAKAAFKEYEDGKIVPLAKIEKRLGKRA